MELNDLMNSFISCGVASPHIIELNDLMNSFISCGVASPHIIELNDLMNSFISCGVASPHIIDASDFAIRKVLYSYALICLLNLQLSREIFPVSESQCELISIYL